MTRLMIPAAFLALAGCAQSPDSIAPVAMPAGMYDSLSCQAAANERAAVAQSVATFEARQEGC